MIMHGMTKMTKAAWNADDKLTFHSDIQVMEVDFSDTTFDVPRFVHEVYDGIEARLAETGQKWFFLVNYRQCRIMSEAWITFAHRGKKVNLAYSLGSVRYAATGKTSEAIMESSREENFDPNLFDSRDEALLHLGELRREIPENEYEARLRPTLASDGKAPADRVTFHEDLQIMEADFSNHVFASSADVNALYDEITRQIEATGKKWYFLVNYEGTEILPEAWYTWALRGRRLNTAHSLGTVRFSPAEATRQDILRRARADEFDANLVASRKEALARIEALKNAGGGSSPA